jgi:hypothetical protein
MTCAQVFCVEVYKRVLCSFDSSFFTTILTDRSSFEKYIHRTHGVEVEILFLLLMTLSSFASGL